MGGGGVCRTKRKGNKVGKTYFELDASQLVPASKISIYVAEKPGKKKMLFSLSFINFMNFSTYDH